MSLDGYIATLSGAYDWIIQDPDMDFAAVRGLSREVQQKLSQQRPETIGQASRIQGVTPAAISLLLVHLKRRSLSRESREHSA